MLATSRRGYPARSRPGDAARLFARGITVRPYVPVAAVVGCVLSAINEGTQLAEAGQFH
jgi:hypothetical protein